MEEPWQTENIFGKSRIKFAPTYHGISILRTYADRPAMVDESGNKDVASQEKQAKTRKRHMVC
jgi:hypothetical protein